MRISNKTKLYLSCSAKPGNFGATLYNRLFDHYGINALYIPRYCIKAKELIEAVRLLNCDGCSVSMPLKNQVIPYLDELSDFARRAQSVNTIVNQDGRLIGHNTDIFGAIKTLEKTKLNNVIIYGAGSVVDSLLIALNELGITEISIFSRNPEKALAKYKHRNTKVIKNLDEAKSNYDLLINATPAPFDGNLTAILDRVATVFDLLVSPNDTDLITAAKKAKKETITGNVMSKYQFQKQFECYTSLVPHIEDISTILNDLYMNV